MRFLNHKVVEDLCEVVGSVCRVEDVNKMDGGSFIRVRVLININTPLCRGWRFFSSQGEQGWVSFKYERLPNLCYWCGCLSHGDRDCEIWLDSEGIEEGRTSLWLLDLCSTICQRKKLGDQSTGVLRGKEKREATDIQNGANSNPGGGVGS